jgi:hypothetical protein
MSGCFLACICVLGGYVNADALWAAMEAESLLLRADMTEEGATLGDAILEYQRVHAAELQAAPAEAPLLTPARA